MPDDAAADAGAAAEAAGVQKAICSCEGAIRRMQQHSWYESHASCLPACIHTHREWPVEELSQGLACLKSLAPALVLVLMLVLVPVPVLTPGRVQLLLWHGCQYLSSFLLQNMVPGSVWAMHGCMCSLDVLEPCMTIGTLACIEASTAIGFWQCVQEHTLHTLHGLLEHVRKRSQICCAWRRQLRGRGSRCGDVLC